MLIYQGFWSVVRGRFFFFLVFLGFFFLKTIYVPSCRLGHERAAFGYSLKQSCLMLQRHLGPFVGVRHEVLARVQAWCSPSLSTGKSPLRVQ